MLEKHHTARFRLAVCRYPRVPRKGADERVDPLDVRSRKEGLCSAGENDDSILEEGTGTCLLAGVVRGNEACMFEHITRQHMPASYTS